jgi:hypothetical protein
MRNKKDAGRSFTPGPWKLEAGRSIVTDGGRFNLAYSTDKKTGAASFPNFLELDANAALIAAAPDLLAALERVMECHRLKISLVTNAGAVEQARAAIAKAKGDK